MECVNDDIITIHHIFDQPDTRYNSHRKSYAVARDDGYVLMQLFNDEEIELIPGPTIPRHEIEKLKNKYQSAMTSAKDYGNKVLYEQTAGELYYLLEKYKDTQND